MVEAAHKFKLKKDDTVQIIAGKDKGKKGRILKIFRDTDRVVVEGANIVKKSEETPQPAGQGRHHRS